MHYINILTFQPRYNFRYFSKYFLQHLFCIGSTSRIFFDLVLILQGHITLCTDFDPHALLT